MVYEDIRDWKKYLENVFGRTFYIDGKYSIQDLLKKHPRGDEFDTIDVFTLEFFADNLEDINTLRDALQEYPGDYSFSDPFDDLNNWVVESGSPAIAAGKLQMSVGDEVSRIPTINGDRVTIKMQSADVTQTPACRYYIDARAPGATTSTQILEVKIDDSMLKYDNGTENDIQAVSNDTEYEVVIDFDFTNKTFTITVDTVEQVTDAAFETTTAEKIYQVRITGGVGSTYMESFEEVAPAGWTYVNAARSGEQASLGSYSVKPDTNGGLPAWAYYTITTPRHISIDVMVGNNGAYIPFYQTGPPGTLVCYFDLNAVSGKILFNTYELASSFDLLTWYTLEMRNIDWIAKTADIYLNGAFIVSATWSSTAPTIICLQCVDNASYCYYDNFVCVDFNAKAKFDDFKNEFVGSHPAVIQPINSLYKDKHKEKHWWTAEWEVWN